MRLGHLRREKEAARVLSEVLSIAVTERVDVLLLAGDIFDSVAPPPEAERIAYDFFRQLVDFGIRAVAVGGNHDHPRRLAAAARILDLVGVHLLGELSPDPQRSVATVPSRDGSEAATVVMVPWVRESSARAFEAVGTAQGAAQYAQRVAAVMN